MIIVGGIGSMPGSRSEPWRWLDYPSSCGSLPIIRLLVYEAALMAMMLLRPEGLWPEATRRRELHERRTGCERAQPAKESADLRLGERMAVITITNLTKQFGELVAVENLDIEVKEQSIHSVIGPNGAGKTTLFNCITGFYRPEIGDIRLDDHSLVGFIPDQIVRHGIAGPIRTSVSFPI